MKRLIVASDFSRQSGWALLRAMRLAKRDGASVRIIHSDDRNAGAADAPAVHRRLVAEGGIMAEEIGAEDLDISTAVRSGNAAEAILTEADAFDADLIIMGAHGAPRFRDALFGTTASHVVRHSGRPVLIVQGKDGTPYPEAIVAVDDPLGAQPLLTTLLAVAPDAKIVVLHAFAPTLGQALSGSAEIERREKLVERQMREAVLAAAAAVRPQSGGGDFQAVVRTGEVLAVLMKAYEELEPALLAVGTRENATYLGSHAVDSLFWCPRDLLVVPDGAKAVSSLRAAVGLEG